MVGRPFGHPALQKRAHVRFEVAAGVRVAGGGDRAVHALPLGDHEFELPMRRDADAQHRDRAFAELELHARARAGLAVIFPQAPQDGLALGDVDVMRAIVADENESLLKIDRVELGKAAADVQPVHDQHRDAGLQVRLAAHREPGGRQQRVADDQVGHQAAERAALLPFVIVRQPVELLLVDELVERHRHARGHVQVFIGQPGGERIGNRIGGVEQVEDRRLLRLDLRVAHAALVAEQLVGLGLDDVAAERRGQRRLIRLHVEHVLDRVAEVADPRPPQIVQHHGNVAPLGQLRLRLRVAVERAEDHRRYRAADPRGDAGKLRHRAEVVVAELDVGRRFRVVHRLERL